MAGFPGKTNYFTDSSFDTLGGKLVVSVGKFTAVDPKKMIAEITNLGKTGLSGGPTFNEKGQFMGIHCSGTQPKDKDKSETAISVFAIYDKEALKTLWSGLTF